MRATVRFSVVTCKFSDQPKLRNLSTREAVDTTQLVNELTAALEAVFGGDAGSPALEFPQPDGNGVAFAKFVEIYEELLTISEQQAAAPRPESEPPAALDVLA